MAKFIIELSNDYIAKMSDIEQCEKAYEGKNSIAMMAAWIGFREINKKIESGISEFSLSGKDFKDSSLDFFEKTCADICILTHMKQV